jgi:protein TonB
MRQTQSLVRRDRDLNSSKQFIRSIGISAVAHAAFILGLVLFAQWSYKPNIIVPGYTVDLVSMQKKPGSLLDPSPVKGPPKKKKPQVKKKPYKKIKKKKTTKVKKKTSKAKKIVPKKKVVPKPSKKKVAPKPKKTPPKPVVEPTPSGGQQSIVTEGDPFTHLWYLKIVERKVRDNWITHGLDAVGQQQNPLVHFTISRDGQVTSMKLEKSSGNEELDRSALAAVREAQPFPQLPDDFKSDSLGIHYEFSYEQLLD